MDTRSDIYSLGRAAVRAADRHHAVRQGAVRGGGVLTRSAGSSARRSRPSRAPGWRSRRTALPSISAQRQTEPARLTRLVRGELDWIVMKALEKDRTRRYETANGFAADVQRYLDDEPVQACPPSAWYRLRKFARRNKAGAGDGVRRRPGGGAGGGGTGDQHRPHRAGPASARPTRKGSSPGARARAARARTSTASPWPTASCRRTTCPGRRTPRPLPGRPPRLGVVLPQAAAAAVEPCRPRPTRTAAPGAFSPDGRLRLGQRRSDREGLGRQDRPGTASSPRNGRSLCVAFRPDGGPGLVRRTGR